MGITKQQIIKYAKEQRFGDIALVNADDFPNTPNGLISSPRSILKEAAGIIVLFANYLPAKSAPKGSIGLSPYYVASNFSYHASKKMVQYLQESGAKAIRTAYLPAKKAALRAGGYIGDNGFYFHKQFGSYVCIQTILTDALESKDYSNVQDGQNECTHCGVCSAACPSGAVDNVQNCLRYHINETIPQILRGDVYQLFGCEICQSACPKNSRQQSDPYIYPLKELIQGKLVDELKKIAGKNLVSANRLMSQAVLNAANKKEYDLAELIFDISKNAKKPVCTHALYAYNKLKDGAIE